MKRRLGLWAGTVLILASGGAQAALFDRGGGMIYDSTLNLTWLADVNYAHSSGYAAAHAGGSTSNGTYIDAGGQMGWHAAQTWADGLVYGGFDDWRLPTINPNDGTCTALGAYGCSGGEISHLFVVDLGEKAFEPVYQQSGDTPQQIANQALFLHLARDGNGIASFWTGTAYPGNANLAYYFNATQAGQDFQSANFGGAYAMAVRVGDVAAVPEPRALALMLAGLGLLGLIGRRGLRP
ncbi:hypothetical protein HNP55_001948 [Paucibacter oligotrophus]|uniref:Secreted protein with PEP-CTERM sorting signal n=1 Tax=Roseateles oligotrophus TaxID=1769250 RepID=A0A840LBE9_9BURK|nr:PEP-CTERM sorting domain-containing protein [Roseateles oligotrophus]MBB4843429.1 hypothetical protein [Roseateles oligotrophus]